MGPFGRLLLAGLLPAFLLPVAVSASLAAQQAGGDARPLTKSEVVRLLVTGTYSEEEVLGIVRRSCLTFRPSSLDLVDFRSLGAGEAVVEALRRCGEEHGGGSVGRSAATGATSAEGAEGVTVPAGPGEIFVDAPLLDVDRVLERTLRVSPDTESYRARPVPPALPTLREGESFLAELERPPGLLDGEALARTVGHEMRRLAAEDGRTSGPLRCELWVFVDSTGRVLDARVERSSGSEAFDRIAFEAVSLAAYRPALERGRPVGSWVRQVVAFSP